MTEICQVTENNSRQIDDYVNKLMKQVLHFGVCMRACVRACVLVCECACGHVCVYSHARLNVFGSIFPHTHTHTPKCSLNPYPTLQKAYLNITAKRNNTSHETR